LSIVDWRFIEDWRLVRATVLVTLVGLAAAQAAAPAQPRLKSGTELVHVDVTVTDDSGRMVTGLPREAFEVLPSR
jgi:hypothetical protein